MQQLERDRDREEEESEREGRCHDPYQVAYRFNNGEAFNLIEAVFIGLIDEMVILRPPLAGKLTIPEDYMHIDIEIDFEDLGVKSNDFAILESALDTGDDKVLVNDYRETIKRVFINCLICGLIDFQ